MEREKNVYNLLERVFLRKNSAERRFLSYSSLWCLSHLRFCPVYLYCVYRKIVCHQARRQLEQKNRLSTYKERRNRERARRGSGRGDETDRKLRRSDGGRVRAYRREKWTKKGSFPRGFIGWRRFPTAILRREAYVPASPCVVSLILLIFPYVRGCFPFRRLRRRCNDCVL